MSRLTDVALTPPRRRVALVPALIALLGLASLAVVLGGLAVTVRNGGPVGWGPPCPLHALTGWHCPGCGTTRMLTALLHGNVIAALGYNPLAFTALAVAPLLLSSRVWRGWGRLSLPTRSRVAWGLALVVVLYALIRNIPTAPFTLLAP